MKMFFCCKNSILSPFILMVIFSIFWPVRDISASSKAVTKKYPYILLVYCDGGWDQTMVFDSKIGVSTAAQESGAAVAETS